MRLKFGYKKRSKEQLTRFFCLCLLLVVCICWSFTPVAWAEESPPPSRIILTWTIDPTTTQTITWLMQNGSPSRVQYLRAEEYEGDFDSAEQIVAKGELFDTDGNIYRYTANLTGLTPNTKYVYRVGRDGSWSEPASFTTAADTECFSFLYMGDVQSGYEAWGDMLDSAYEACPEIRFALLGGDLTDKGHDKNEWMEFLDAAKRVFCQIPVMPTMGNHDGAMYLKFFELPDNGPSGLKKEFYSFDYGNAHFVILNSNNNTSAAVKQWLQQDLAETDKKWKFVMFHHPAYPVVFDHKGIDKSIRENWVPILEEKGVDMVFVGHQHVYMRTHPILQGEVKSDSYGIVYVMGNAGSKTYVGGGGFHYIAKERTGSNYQVISINGDVLTLTAKDASGELIETFTIDKSAEVQPEKPKYSLIPKEDPVYNIGTTPDGICKMTVNEGQSGFKYFTVSIEPVVSHEGEETVVFTHIRTGKQIGLSATVADFDLVKGAQAGLHVNPDDIIKVFVIDKLTSDLDCNPIILQ
jgi:DNA repair exonuclease SbcCD nuclease subunit